MIDAEVLRLRKLRNAALRARALATVLDSKSENDASVFARSAVACWTIARIATGRLRAHPYLSYQRGPSRLRDLADEVIVAFIALNGRRRNRRSSVCAQQLQVVVREVNDVRALTWSPDLSDALGRMQIQMRRLAHELDLCARGEAGTVLLPRAAATETSNSLHEIAEDSAWPYLAI